MDNTSHEEEENTVSDDYEEGFDWYIQQVEEEDSLVLGSSSLRDHGYGFGFAQVGVFGRLAEELGELLDIANPDGQTHRQRRQAAEAKEAAKFDSDHYLCDLYESDEIDHLLRYVPVPTLILAAI